MARYISERRLALAKPIAPGVYVVAGRAPLVRHPVRRIWLAQDSITNAARRVICTWGANGTGEWFALDPSSDPPGTSQTLPEDGAQRVVARWKGRLTPGQDLNTSLLYIPSGATEEDVGGGNWDIVGARGRIEIEVKWYDPEDVSNTVTTTHAYNLEGSTFTQGTSIEYPGKEPPGDGQVWSTIRLGILRKIRPDDTERLQDELHEFMRGAIVEIKVTAEGGARVLDGCIYEEPYAIAMEADDDPVLPYHFNVSKLFTPVSNRWPIQRVTETTPDGDPRWGTWHTMDVNEQIHKQLGPNLLSWSAFREQDDSPGSVTPYLSLTNTGFQNICDTSETEWSSTTGQAVWCGCGWSENFREGAHVADYSIIPVRIFAYGAQSSGTGTIRIQTGAESWAELEITGASDAWHDSTIGYLRVGRTPEQSTPLQVFAKVTAGTMTLHAITVQRDYRALPT